MAILVCPLSRVDQLIAERGPARVVSLLDPGGPFPDHPAYGPDRHLRVGMHDIVSPFAGTEPPGPSHVDALIAFVSAWDHSAPILIHCRAGISRSTASAFITACVHNPDADETIIATALRRASPTASPNPLLVALADAALGRAGRMRKAIEGIGRGLPAWPVIDEAVPFELQSRYP